MTQHRPDSPEGKPRARTPEGTPPRDEAPDATSRGYQPAQDPRTTDRAGNGKPGPDADRPRSKED